MAYEDGTTAQDRRGATVLLMLAAAGLGALMGILYAPRAGERTRRHLRRRYEDLRDRATDLGDDLVASVEDVRYAVVRRLATGYGNGAGRGAKLTSVAQRWRAIGAH